MAADLDVQYDAHGPRPAAAVHWVKPAKRVKWAEWHNGELDVWIRDHDQWLGRVRDLDGNISWIRGPDLRPEDAP
jgi:hypothetical protein